MQIICGVIASYTLVFFMAKNLWLVFRMKHKTSKQNFVVFSFMYIIQFHGMEKNFIVQFYSMKKMLIMLFSYNFGNKKTDEKAQILIPE